MSKSFKIGSIVVGVVLAICLILTPMFIEKIPTGSVGLVYSPSGGVQDEPLTEGWSVIGLFDKVIEYPTKRRTIEAKDMVLATKDGKNIQLDISYSYKVDGTKVVSLFKEFGNLQIEDIEDSYLEKRLLDASRQSIAKYDLLSVYGEGSSQVGLDIQKAFEEDVKNLGFLISDVAMGSPKPDKSTQKAIDARIAASQENEKKKLELENDKIEAERKKVQAQGEADATKIKAKGEADANLELSKSLTPELLKKMEFEARKTHGWVTIQGAGSTIVDTTKDK